MADSNSEPPRCQCGFWGSAQNQGLCSKCYRELQKKTTEADNTAPAPVTFSADAFSQALESVKPLSPVESEQPASGTTAQQNSGASNVDAESSTNGESTEEPMAAEPSPQAAAEEVENTEDAKVSTSNNGKDPQPGSKRERHDTEGDNDPDKPVQKNKKRCFKCNIKLELAIREIGRCRCDYVFCQLHRLPEQHDCIYDHKEKGRQEAREKMVSPKKHVGTSLKRIDSDS
jgi:hypothetical protein